MHEAQQPAAVTGAEQEAASAAASSSAAERDAEQLLLQVLSAAGAPADAQQAIVAADITSPRQLSWLSETDWHQIGLSMAQRAALRAELAARGLLPLQAATAYAAAANSPADDTDTRAMSSSWLQHMADYPLQGPAFDVHPPHLSHAMPPSWLVPHARRARTARSQQPHVQPPLAEHPAHPPSAHWSPLPQPPPQSQLPLARAAYVKHLQQGRDIAPGAPRN